MICVTAHGTARVVKTARISGGGVGGWLVLQAGESWWGGVVGGGLVGGSRRCREAANTFFIWGTAVPFSCLFFKASLEF